MHEGHRQRMIERLKNAPHSLQDHEILEILLFNAIPRKNTNGIAHELLNAFGTLSGVLEASMEQLMLVSGVGTECAAYLNIISLAMQKSKPNDGIFPNIYTPFTAIQFAESRLCGLRDEMLEVYCIDENCKVRFIKQFTSLQADKVSLSRQAITKVISVQQPAAVVVAHNHPFGSEKPSQKDDVFTASMCMICSMNGVQFRDHVIVGKARSYSYVQAGKLEPILAKYAVENIIEEE